MLIRQACLCPLRLLSGRPVIQKVLIDEPETVLDMPENQLFRRIRRTRKLTLEFTGVFKTENLSMIYRERP